jgi:CRISPR-associated endonuclease Csn1
LPWENFRADIKDALNEVFVSRAPTRKATGGVHDANIRSTKRMTNENNVTTSKTKLKDLTLTSLENLPEKETRNANLYAALKKRIQAGGKEPFATPFYLGKNGEESDAVTGRLINGIKLERTTKTGVLVRGGLADNGEMLRVDVFTKAGKFYLVPIYLADRVGDAMPHKAIRANTPEKDWLNIDNSYQFLFSLSNNDLVLISDKDGGEGAFLRGYYKGTHRGTGAINVEGHDRSWKKEGIGVQRLEVFKKLQVDPLGEVFEVKKEPRRGLAESAD